MENTSSKPLNKVKTPWYKHYGNCRPHLTYPDTSLYDMLFINIKAYLQNNAYNYFGVTSTYAKLLDDIEKCAKALKSLGIKSGDRVTICMPNTPEAVISFYALNMIGAFANMIHPLSAENEIRHYLNISESIMLITIDLSWCRVKNALKSSKVKNVVVVSVADSMPMMLKLGFLITKGRKIEKPKKSGSILYWKSFIKCGSKYNGVLNEHIKGDGNAAILYSGGTTGNPKGIILTNLNFNALALQSIEACQCLREKDKVLSIMPIFHGFGLGICIHTVLNFGGTAVILPHFSAKSFHKLLRKYKPNVIAGVPTLYEAFINNKKIQKMDLSFLKCVISGGDSLSISLKKKLDDFLKSKNANTMVREGYGLTECVTGSCLTPIDMYKEGSVGIPYPDTYYKIVKPTTHIELPYGEEGEIVLSGPSVMTGYLNEQKESDEALQVHEDGLVWLHTGDLGFMDEDGFVYFKQRLKRMIVSSGYNIYPQYVENVLDQHPDVLMSVVVGIDHPYKKQVAKAFIVLKSGIQPSEKLKNEIMEHCKKNLVPYSLPYEIVFKDSLPKTLVGKIAYNKLIQKES